MRCLGDISSRFRSVNKGFIVFFGSVCIFFSGVHDGVAQEKKEGWSLRACIETMPGSMNLQVGTPGGIGKIRLLNYPEGRHNVYLVEFFQYSRVGTSEKDRNKRGFEIIECLHG